MLKNKPVNKKKRSQPTPLKGKEAPKGRKDRWIKKAFGLKSMLVAIVGGWLFFVIISNDAGYQWVWKNLLKGNWDIILQHRNATLDERYQMKLGFDYVFLNHIKQNTPEDAVILFPLKKCTTEKGGDSQLSGNINSKYWVTHFVYPRRILYKDEQETNSRYSDVTHVAIVAGHGYEDLNYPVMERYYFTVLPKNAAEK